MLYLCVSTCLLPLRTLVFFRRRQSPPLIVAFSCLIRFFCILLFQGKYDETVKECSKAIELNPAYVKALLRRGEAYEKLERYEEAISGELRICYETFFTKVMIFL